MHSVCGRQVEWKGREQFVGHGRGLGKGGREGRCHQEEEKEEEEKEEEEEDEEEVVKRCWGGGANNSSKRIN